MSAIPQQLILFSVPVGWTRRVHPLGYVYYHKMHHGRVYIARDEIEDPYWHNFILGHIDDVERLILLRNDVPSNNVLVYLELLNGGGSDCGYFLINNAPESPCIFFLHDIDLTKDQPDAGADGPSAFGACCNAIKLVSRPYPRAESLMATLYWTFVYHFPHLVQLKETFLDELSSMFVHFLAGMFVPWILCSSQSSLKCRI